MPRYYFCTENGVRSEDREGVELSSPAHARAAAITFAGDFLSDDPDLIWDGEAFKVEVTDEQGANVVTVVVRAIDGPGGA